MDAGQRAIGRDDGTFQPHDQYRIIHGRSHRKSPARVGTPALTRHLALWIPAAPKQDTITFHDHREMWIKSIDWFFASFILRAYLDWQKQVRALLLAKRKPDFQRQYDHLMSLIPMSFNAEDLRESLNEDPHYKFRFFRHTAFYEANSFLGEGLVTFEQNDPADASDAGPTKNVKKASDDSTGDRFETVSFRLFYAGIPIKVRAELHTEYFTLSFTAELDAEGDDDTFTNDVRKSIKAAFHRLALVVRRCCKEQGRQRTRADETRRVHRHVLRSKRACAFLVEEFWRLIDANLVLPALTPTFAGPQGDKEEAPPHGSLRDKLGKYITDCRGLVLAADWQEGEGWTLAQPFASRMRTSLHDYVGPDHFSKKEAIDIFGVLEPIVHAAREASAGAHLAKSPFRRPDKRVFEYAVSRIQRNRALYITALGPQPLWSDYHEPLCYLVVTRHRHRWQIGRFLDRMNMLGTLRVASLIEYASLNKAGFMLREMSQKLDRLTAVGSNARQRRQECDDLHEELRKIQSAVAGGGLLYRTERSLFYVRNFRAEYRAMKFGRVEGFQPYPSFVERRLGQTWDFIGVLNQRCEQVARRLSELSDRIRAEEENQQTIKLGRLQVFAEAAATIPIAYYGGYALEVIFHRWIGHGIWWILKHVTPLGIMMPGVPNHHHPYLAIYMVLAALGYWAAVLWWRRKHEREEGKP